MNLDNLLPWVLFNLFVMAMLAIDLFVFHRKSHKVSMRESLLWTVGWIVLALIFCVGVHYKLGHQKALEFLTGYLIEKSLSVDNLFVFLLIFAYFCVPEKFQHKILFWGILGALFFRAVFIFAGVALIHQFHWIIYIFGAFLIFTGIRLWFEKDKKMECGENPVVRFFKKFFSVTDKYHDDKFFIREGGKLVATPLVIVLIVVETTDIIFAVDSIPAIFAVTLDPFIVFTSNVFAILGLRALYFALANVMGKFHCLHYGLSVILVFVGIKMFISEFYKIPIYAALGVIIGVLALSIAASFWIPEHKSDS